MATFFTYFLTQNFKKPPNLVTLIVGDNLGKEKGRRLGTGGRMLLSVYSRCRNSLSRCLSSPSLSLSFSSSLHLTHHPSVSLSLSPPLSLSISRSLFLSQLLKQRSQSSAAAITDQIVVITFQTKVSGHRDWSANLSLSLSHTHTHTNFYSLTLVEPFST